MELTQHICVTFDLLEFKVILVSFDVLVLKWPANRKTSGCRVKPVKFRNWGLTVDHIGCIFGLVEFKVILGTFSAIALKWRLTRFWSWII